ncbi:hypothetical protein QAD02_021998 [Eretmocerus hayati]|uniref:Uncharacterized protein n=1 Tax=Eretmocerus hayati TaxID=131215 RepID=A0ACC2PSB2_9HYME|nr:hypothetical protein QAD02_021998 [Eretmocerus hayati]
MSMYVGDVQALQVLTNYSSDVNAVDFAGDNVLVTGSGDKKVRVWEWQPGVGFTEVSYSPLLGHKYGVTSVKVSPQSTMLASGSIDGTTQLWNLRSGSKIHTMVQAGGEAVRVCRFSPDSSLLVTAGDIGQVCLWDLVRRTLIRCFQKHEGAIQSMTFTPDSNWLLTSCTLSVLQLFYCNEIIESYSSGDQNLTVYAQADDAHDLGVVCCEFSSIQEIPSNEPDAKLYQLVTCGNDHRVKLWEVKTIQNKCNTQIFASLELCRIMEKHSSALTCVRFSPNGIYIASSGLDKTVILWETSTGRIVSVLTGHNRYVACCAFSRNGHLLATGSNDKRVIIWNLTGNLSLESELIRHNSVRLQRSDSPGKIFIQEANVVEHAESSSNEVKLIQRLDDHQGAVNTVSIFGNRLIASGSGDKLVRVWSVKYDEEGESTSIFQEMSYNPLDGHKYSVNYVEFSPCGTKLASCSMDGTAIIWDIETGNQARFSLVNSGTAVRICRWSPDGTKLATAGDDEKTLLWDMDTMEELRVFEGHADAITSLAFTPDSRYLVTACSEGAWRLFDATTSSNFGEESKQQQWGASDRDALLLCEIAHDLGVQGCDFSPTTGPFILTGSRDASSNCGINSYMLATCGNDSLIKLWRIEARDDDDDDDHDDEEQQQHFGEDAAEGGSSSPESRPKLTYKERRQLVGHGGNVMCVRFAPVHGEILGSVATDRTARLWSVHTGMCLHVLENHESLVTTCAFSEDTSIFLTGALDKTVLIWKLPQQLVSQSILIDRLRNNRRKVVDWSIDDVTKWLHEIELSELSRSVQFHSISGRLLLRIPEGILMDKLLLEHDQETLDKFYQQLYWLKREDCNAVNITEDMEIPDEFLCPITHEVMREPVMCSDGFTYERAAINEWFLCGKFTSPMTNEPLRTTTLTSNVPLRNAIFTLLHGEAPSFS